MITPFVLVALLITTSLAQNSAQQGFNSTSGLYDFQQNDINTFNYALTLENLEYNFYRTGLANFTADSFTCAGYNSSVYNYFSMIMLHEMSHVNTLTQAISARGGVPVRECTYNFGYTDVASFIAVAQMLENTGVAAYNGAINAITDLSYINAAATIASVEGRHAAFLNQLVGELPWQQGNATGFDPAATPAQIFANASKFIVSCDNATQGVSSLTIQLPVPATFALNNATNVSMSVEDLNDVHVLQYALTLEHLEYSFYTWGLSHFSAQNYTDAGYNSSVYEMYRIIQNLEYAHVLFLNNTLNCMGGYGLPFCTYNYTNIPGVTTNVTTFFVIADMLQNVGTWAFDGSANHISNLITKQAAATIATIEGRFSAYTNELVGISPFPMAFDNAYTPEMGLAAASQFIVSCPYDIILPQIANFSVASQISGLLNSNNSSASTSTGQQATSTGQQATAGIVGGQTSTSGQQGGQTSTSSSGQVGRTSTSAQVGQTSSTGQTGQTTNPVNSEGSGANMLALSAVLLIVAALA